MSEYDWLLPDEDEVNSTPDFPQDDESVLFAMHGIVVPVYQTEQIDEPDETVESEAPDQPVDKAEPEPEPLTREQIIEKWSRLPDAQVPAPDIGTIAIGRNKTSATINTSIWAKRANGTATGTEKTSHERPYAGRTDADSTSLVFDVTEAVEDALARSGKDPSRALYAATGERVHIEHLARVLVAAQRMVALRLSQQGDVVGDLRRMQRTSVSEIINTFGGSFMNMVTEQLDADLGQDVIVKRAILSNFIKANIEAAGRLDVLPTAVVHALTGHNRVSQANVNVLTTITTLMKEQGRRPIAPVQGSDEAAALPLNHTAGSYFDIEGAAAQYLDMLESVFDAGSRQTAINIPNFDDWLASITDTSDENVLSDYLQFVNPRHSGWEQQEGISDIKFVALPKRNVTPGPENNMAFAFIADLEDSKYRNALNIKIADTDFFLTPAQITESLRRRCPVDTGEVEVWESTVSEGEEQEIVTGVATDEEDQAEAEVATWNANALLIGEAPLVALYEHAMERYYTLKASALPEGAMTLGERRLMMLKSKLPAGYESPNSTTRNAEDALMYRYERFVAQTVAANKLNDWLVEAFAQPNVATMRATAAEYLTNLTNCRRNELAHRRDNTEMDQASYQQYLGARHQYGQYFSKQSRYIREQGIVWRPTPELLALKDVWPQRLNDFVRLPDGGEFDSQTMNSIFAYGIHHVMTHDVHDDSKRAIVEALFPNLYQVLPIDFELLEAMVAEDDEAAEQARLDKYKQTVHGWDRVFPSLTRRRI